MRLRLKRHNVSYYLYLQKLTKKPGVKEFLGITLSLITVSVFLLLALKPSLTKIAALKKDIEASKQTLNRLKKKTAALAKVEQIWAVVGDESQKVEKTIPLGPEYNYFIKEVEWVASQTGVRYVNGSFSASLIRSSLVDAYRINQHLAPIEIKVNLRFEGNYSNLLATLNRLTELDRILAVESVTINQNDKKEKKGSLVMTIGGKIYYFGDKAKIDQLLKQTKKRR